MWLNVSIVTRVQAGIRLVSRVEANVEGFRRNPQLVFGMRTLWLNAETLIVDRLESNFVRL